MIQLDREWSTSVDFISFVFTGLLERVPSWKHKKNAMVKINVDARSAGDSKVAPQEQAKAITAVC
ncbi:MAG: hypothetical protein Rhob2KO_09810 [Rhodopirellula baltica]